MAKTKDGQNRKQYRELSELAGQARIQGHEESLKFPANPNPPPLSRCGRLQGAGGCRDIDREERYERTVLDCGDHRRI